MHVFKFYRQIYLTNYGIQSFVNLYGTIYLGLNLARNQIYFALMFHVDFFANTTTTSTTESSMLSSNVNVDHRSRTTTGSHLNELDLLLLSDASPCDIN